MQVSSGPHKSLLAKQKSQLKEQSSRDQEKAENLEKSGLADLAEAQDRQELSQGARERGEEFKKESNRLRRNGREQSLRGLNRIADAGDKYSEAFSGTETGMAELQGAAATLESAHQDKGQGLVILRSGLATQAQANQDQGSLLDAIASNNTQDQSFDSSKASQAQSLAQNVETRKDGLNTQTEKIADFLIAGADYDQAAQSKSQGFASLNSSVQHKVAADGLQDLAHTADVQKTFSEADEKRHDKTSGKLRFASLWEGLKAKAASINSAYYQSIAVAKDASAEMKDAQANSIEGQATALKTQGGLLIQSGQNHVAQGRQMQTCPCTFCPGKALEEQGHAEIQQGRRLKSLAKTMKSEAQSLRLDAEEDRVRAEMAGDTASEQQITQRGSEVRSGLLAERSKKHEKSASNAEMNAQKSATKSKNARQGAAEQAEIATELSRSGLESISSGTQSQFVALDQQKAAATEFANEVDKESQLTSDGQTVVGNAAETLAKESFLLQDSASLVGQLGESHKQEGEAQNQVSAGIEKIRTGIASSTSGQSAAELAAEKLEEARGLELEGLRLQNRGQKMLLEARPKMAEAARLSAASFDEFKSADSNEEQAEALIAKGTQKLAAASILREKAAAYKALAG